MAKTIGGTNKIVLVEIGALKVHPTAQRRVHPSKRKKLIDTLDLDAIGTLHVVELNDTMWIIDGQHRWSALMHHGLGELSKKLAKYPGGASGIIGDAKGLQRLRRGNLTRSIAETVVTAYNNGRRTKLELP